MYKEGRRIAFPSSGIFGHCTDSDYLKFMNNEEASSCVIKEVAAIGEAECTQASFGKFGKLEFASGDGETVITPTVGAVRKFSVSTFREVDLDGQDEYTADFMPSSFLNGVCDNFVLEMHYKVYFTAVGADLAMLTDETEVAGVAWGILKAAGGGYEAMADNY